MAAGETAPDPSDSALSKPARWVLGLLGILLAGLAVYLTIDPPTVREFAPQCASTDCIAEVDQPAEVTAVALAGMGALLVLVGVNGRKVIGLKFGGAEATLDGAAKDAQAKALLAADVGGEPAVEGAAPAELEPGEGTASVLTIGDAELVRVDPSQVPARVLTDLAGGGARVRSSSDIDWGARRLGQGNNPWYVHLKSGQTYKVSYGGQGLTGATVSPVE